MMALRTVTPSQAAAGAAAGRRRPPVTRTRPLQQAAVNLSLERPACGHESDHPGGPARHCRRKLEGPLALGRRAVAAGTDTVGPSGRRRPRLLGQPGRLRAQPHCQGHGRTVAGLAGYLAGPCRAKTYLLIFQDI